MPQRRSSLGKPRKDTESPAAAAPRDVASPSSCKGEAIRTPWHPTPPSTQVQPEMPDLRSAESPTRTDCARSVNLHSLRSSFVGFDTPSTRTNRNADMNAMQFLVQGGHRLSGTIRPSGNKNAALPIICAALLTDQRVALENVPRIRDVETLVELIASLGVDAEWSGRNSLEIHAKTVRATDLDPKLCRRIRASILLAGPLLARCGQIELPPPGGDVSGRRRVDTHFLALERLGAAFELDDSFHLTTPGLRGADVFLDEPSVTGTENALMAAVAASGTTVLRNAASEPHVQDLCHFLIALGAEIDGIGTNKLTIDGGRPLSGATHRIGPDHIEVGSFIGLAAVTCSELRIADAGVEHLRSTLMGFARLGVSCTIEGPDLIVPAVQEKVIQSDLGGHVSKLEDQPWPAFPADTMSIALVTATQCSGMILIHEKMFG